MTHYMVRAYSNDNLCAGMKVYETKHDAICFAATLDLTKYKLIHIERIEGLFFDKEENKEVDKMTMYLVKGSLDGEQYTCLGQYTSLDDALHDLFEHSETLLFKRLLIEQVKEPVVDTEKEMKALDLAKHKFVTSDGTVGFKNPNNNNALHYPDVCPKCGSPAYVGIFKMDCSNPDCESHHVK